MRMTVDPFALGARETLQDPYPVYARLRAEAPVHFTDAWGGWVIARYADTLAAFRDARLSANRAGGYAQKMPPEVRQKLEPLVRHLAKWTLLMDAPEHTRLRGLIQRAFGPQRAESLRPRIEAISTKLVASLARGEPFDVVRDLAMPLPVIVIGELLGVPEHDHPKLKAWSDALAAFMGGSRDPMGAASRALDAIAQLEDYFRSQIAAKRRERGDDLLSALVVAEENGKLLDEQELLSTCASVLFGGHETTTNLIGNAVHLFIEHPGALGAVRRGDATWTQAIEEVLRFDTPVQRMGRIALEDIDIAGMRIERGQRVWLAMGSANRDDAAFERAETFDVLRTGSAKHLSFGFGAHYCVGAALGRVEAEIAVRALFDTAPTLARVGEVPERLQNFTIRGFEGYEVRG